MPHTTSDCDPAAIDALLSGGLAEERARAVETHLETCTLCRARIDGLAVAPDDWREIREHLSDDGSSFVQAGGDSESALAGSGKAALGIVKYLAPTDDPEMLGRLGAYEVTGVIGSGGMGVVLKGFDRSLNRFVAIKVLAPHLAANAAARRRFSREAQAAAAVVHDNVVAIHGVSEANGLPFLVMPYIRGRSLQKRLDERGVLAVVETLRIAHQVAAGLAAAHAQGLVHRDIKPANILLEEGVERLKITDFGLARAVDDASLTHSGVIAGTPQYMSPEQARGDSIDPRSDLFSLGSMLYALCTGRPPFRAETSYGILRRITDEEPHAIREINPEIPDWLAAIVGKLLAKQPADRFASADEVAQLLERCLAHVQQPTTVPLPTSAAKLVPRPAPPRRASNGVRQRLAALAGLVVVGAILVFVFRPADSTPDASNDMANGRSAATSGATLSNPQTQNVDPATDWTAMKQPIDDLLQDGDEFQRRVGGWWELGIGDLRPERPATNQPGAERSGDSREAPPRGTEPPTAEP